MEPRGRAETSPVCVCVRYLCIAFLYTPPPRSAVVKLKPTTPGARGCQIRNRVWCSGFADQNSSVSFSPSEPIVEDNQTHLKKSINSELFGIERGSKKLSIGG